MIPHFANRRNLVSLLAVLLLLTDAAYATKPAVPSTPREWYREGKGRTLVMLGGGTYGAGMFEAHAHALADSFDVIRVQTLNVQAAETDAKVPSNYSVSGEAAALRETLVDIGITHPVDIVGASYGAVVALHYAVTYPNAVRTVTLFEPPAFWILSEADYQRDPSLREMRELLGHMKSSATPTDQQLFRFRCILGACPPAIPVSSDPARPEWDLSRRAMQGLAVTFTHREDPRSLKRLAQSKAILLLHGSQTVSFHRKINQSLARKLPEVNVAEIEGGHSAPRANPSAFVKVLRAFLAAHP